jgi:hypothetical protein
MAGELRGEPTTRQHSNQEKEQAVRLVQQLTELGGSTEVFTLGDAELAEVDAVASAVEAAEEAAPGIS